MKRCVSCLSSLVLLFLTGQSSAATQVRGFPLKLEGQADVAPPLAIDIDGDGRLELVVATRTRLHVIEADGSRVAGFPLSFPRGAGVSTPVAAGVLSPRAGGSPSLVFGTADGSLAVIEPTGQARQGFPIKLKAPAASAPTLGDLDGDGDLEILVGSTDGLAYVIRADGRPFAGYPASAGAPISSAITLGRFDPKADAVLVFGDEKGRLHAWSRPGREVSGFPYKAKYTLAGQPVLGDVNDDGRFEIAIGSKDYRLHVVGPDGKPIQGYPVETGYRIYAACALVDLDGDGVAEVLAASGDGKLYAFDGAGKPVPGFPVKVGGRLRASPVSADVDLDGRPEIAIGSDRARLVVVRADGKVYPGFPVRLSDRVQVASLLVDLDGNDTLEIVTVSKDGGLSAYKMLKKGRGRNLSAWPQEGHDSARTGVLHPNPPRYTELAVSPSAPATTQALELGYRFFDLDGDPEPATLIRWSCDGKPVAALDGKREVPASMTAKHQKWRFTLQADSDGQLFESPVVQVRNTPPDSPVIDLGPRPARTGDDLRLQIKQESIDADRDKVRYQIAWLRDRLPVKSLSKDRVSARHTRKGQRWTVVVTPSDGEVAGRPARASLTVANTAPGAPRVALKPAAPGVTDPVAVVILEKAKDPDGDPVRYVYRWSVADRALNLAEADGVLPAGMAPKHSRLRVEVVATDGKDLGGSSQATAELVDTPPGSPGIKIRPAAARTGDDLLAQLDRSSADADGDEVRYRFTWQRRLKASLGAVAGQARLPSSQTAKGERWRLLAVPNDGEKDGPAAEAEVVIANSPPSPPKLSAVDARPATTADLQIKVDQPVGDPDGDPAWCEVTWTRDGKQVAAGRDMWRLPAAKTVKHGRYLAAVTPTDGQDSSEPRKLWFEIVNSPPGACGVEIAPPAPVAGQGLSVKLSQRSSDVDGDPVRYRYRWFRDGEPIDATGKPDAIVSELVRRGQHWSVLVTPSDGEADGPSCQAAVVIANRAPVGPVLSFSPEHPTVVGGLRVEFHRAAEDPDGDRLVTQIRWSVDGRAFPAADDEQALPAGLLRKGQRWQVEVVVSDGESSSRPARASVLVGNAPPEAPKVEIDPRKPLSSDELRCHLVASTRDPDGDHLEYRYEWYRRTKGRKAALAKPLHVGSSLPAELTRKNQRWVCRAVASDGSLSGPAGQAEAVVKNAAPTAPKVRIEPSSPSADQPLRCVISTPATDPDGDPVRYRFEWLKDGVAQPFAAQTDQVPVRLTRANDIWQCKVAPGDGRLEGPPAESQEVLVVEAGM